MTEKVLSKLPYREYIRLYASETKDGTFYCKICRKWIPRQRWNHLRTVYRNNVTCAFGSCDDNIFSARCVDRVTNGRCFKFPTIKALEDGTIGRMRAKMRDVLRDT